MPSEEEKLAAYRSEVRRLPLLTSTEEREALTRARHGDDSARKRVVEGHLELTASSPCVSLRSGCAGWTPSRRRTSS
jgi:DNA-directed RNA polymerase sigma subunit (sigma70/sigma32)